jgi:hypothetical protein
MQTHGVAFLRSATTGSFSAPASLSACCMKTNTFGRSTRFTSQWTVGSEGQQTSGESAPPPLNCGLRQATKPALRSWSLHSRSPRHPLPLLFTRRPFARICRVRREPWPGQIARCDGQL